MKSMELVLLLVFLPLTQSVKHSLLYFLTTSPGVQTFPEFVAVSVVDGVQVGYCDSDIKTAEPRQDWVKKLVEDDPQQKQWHIQTCIRAHQDLKALLETLKQQLDPTGGVHVLQEMSGCKWDSETKEVDGYEQYSYDGEDVITLNLKAQTWLFSELAVRLKPTWDKDKNRLLHSNTVLSNICPEWLKKYLDYGNSSLQRTVRPSVSLLQKSPSSPVSCHATGFYPDRATMFWRKDGQELHEDADHGEILPNHDGTFQMRVDLKLSSVKPEDWRKYDCVFNLSGVEDIITKLDKAVIRTNGVPVFPVGAVFGVFVGLMLLSGCITGLFIWWKKKEERNTKTSKCEEDTSQ
ncbi:major histocompatibility complex class I-related gene protein-like isoform X1 [Channa argus]|uniref:major histocompatibility complex class I-related gene protein-like isoform X1 n=1 Tax=Channa argus TaxID=215402 RepID=UPI003522D3F4